MNTASVSQNSLNKSYEPPMIVSSTTSLSMQVQFRDHPQYYQLQSQSSIIIQIMSGSNPSEKYKRILIKLEKAYEEKYSPQRFEAQFKRLINEEFKMDITADSILDDTLKEYYQKCYSDHYSTESFGKKLDFVERVNNMLYDIGFIAKREYVRLREILLKEKNSPANQWLENLPYLKSSVDLTEFRSEFLMRYCNLNQEEMIQIIQSQNADEEMKGHYQQFFRKCLEEGIDSKVINYIEDYFSYFQNKSEMLEPSLIEKLEKRLGMNVGSSESEVKINQSLVNIAQNNAYANDQQAQQRLEDEVKMLERSLRKFSGLNLFKNKKIDLRLGKFGSLTSGFAGIDADLDLTILTNSYINELELLRLLHQFLKKEYKNDEGRQGSRRISVQFIQTAKTPLVQVTISQRGKSQLKVDIIVNNILGIINSKFLSVYASVKWIKTLGLLVKLWGKNQGLISKNYISSYGMILMLIHYLIKSKKAKPILDNRVITKDKPHFQYKRSKLTEIEQFPVYYMFKTNPKDVSIEERANYYKILLGFTHYYAYEFWEVDEKYRIITVDQSMDKEVDKECAITIKDPFDLPHNPGRLKAESRDFFVQKFKDAHMILKAGKKESIQGLFN